MTFTYTDAAGRVHMIDARVSYASNPVPLTMVTCSQCGGQGGEPGSNFGDTGWHPCYRCNATGQEAFRVDLSKPLPFTREDEMPATMASVSGPWTRYYPNGAVPAHVALSGSFDPAYAGTVSVHGSPLIARGQWECCQGCANGDGCYREPEPYWL